MARVVLITVVVGVMVLVAGCGGSLADDVLREGDDIARLFWKRIGAGSSDDLLRTAEDNRSSFNQAVDLTAQAQDRAGYVTQDLCDYLAARYSQGEPVSMPGVAGAEPAAGLTLASQISDTYASAADKQSFVYGVCSTIAYFGGDAPR